jgi:hypothetical protein
MTLRLITSLLLILVEWLPFGMTGLTTKRGDFAWLRGGMMLKTAYHLQATGPL